MKRTYIDLKSISDLHKFYHCEKPKHPLVSIIDFARAYHHQLENDTFYRTGFYAIMCKRIEGPILYGRSHYDFQEGSLMFIAPNQVLASSAETKVTEGWGLFFHPDLLYQSALGTKIHQYSFFNYSADEALQISAEEKNMLQHCLSNIKKEYEQNIDRHTQSLMIDNIQLLLNYSTRFYDRQFLTRSKVNTDIVQKFEKALHHYFSGETLVKTGLPDVSHFAAMLHLSPSYLSDLLNKYTGKTTQEHIHLKVIDKAKEMLWGTEKTISEIAYDLGFKHPSHFTKLFKDKTKYSPSAFRNLN